MRKDVPVSQFLDSMIARAKADKKTIVLPEGNDIRTLKAAEAILAEGIADLIVLGDADDIAAAGCNLEGPASSTSAPPSCASPMPRSWPSCARRRA